MNKVSSREGSSFMTGEDRLERISERTANSVCVSIGFPVQFLHFLLQARM